MPDDRHVLEGVERLVVDGTNVLHALRRSASPAPPAALIGRLRSLVPPGVAVIVVLDGSPGHGLVTRQVTSGVQVRYAGRSSADEAIVALLERDFADSTVGTLVVTDDIELSGAVRRTGARTVRNGWLVARIDRQRLASPSVGRPSTPTPAAERHGGAPGTGTSREIGAGRGRGGGPVALSGPDSEGAGRDEAPRWEPGRGATKKRGNPKRRPTTGR